MRAKYKKELKQELIFRITRLCKEHEPERFSERHWDLRSVICSFKGCLILSPDKLRINRVYSQRHTLRMDTYNTVTNAVAFAGDKSETIPIGEIRFTLCKL